MRISDGSSAVCSSDPARNGRGERPGCSAGSAFCQGGRQGRRRRSECRNGQQGRGRDSGKRGRGPIVRLDITDAASWAGAVEAAVGAFGKLTTLYNTAGIIHGAMIQDETLEGWSKMIAVNQTALFLGLKMVAPEIAKSGNGAILNISSLVRVICEPGLITSSEENT